MTPESNPTKSAAQTLRWVLELGWPLSGAERELEALRELLAENKRLRAALEEIAAVPEWWQGKLAQEALSRV